MKATSSRSTSAHALLRVLAVNGIDRAYLVPGESYLGVLDALSDFDGIDVVTCRHEGGAAFMASVDGKLTGRPGLVMVSRGPGATNAAIGLHAAQQDAAPMILIIGQIPKRDLRKKAFQEIDYQQMFGSIVKWVCEVTEPEQLAAAAFKAIRVATSGVPGPVVLVIPEDIQQQDVAQPEWRAVRPVLTQPTSVDVARVRELIERSTRPMIIAGSALARDGGRQALKALAEKFHVPVTVSFRAHDLFPNGHPLYAGNLDLANPAQQMEAFASSDLIIALGTRLGDITTQGYTFPDYPRPAQTLVHCIADDETINQHFVADVGIVADPVALCEALLDEEALVRGQDARRLWSRSLRAIHERICAWPDVAVSDGVPFVEVVRSLKKQAPKSLKICLDAGTFAAPVYRHFAFEDEQRLIASFSGSMGYGVPSAMVAQLRNPSDKVVCMVGDGGFMMTGNEMMAAVDRKLPILFILSNNNCYGSIRIHQDRTYPGRYVGTDINSPDFVAVARAFGVKSERVESLGQVDSALARGLAADEPYLIEVKTSLNAILLGQSAKAVAERANATGD
ncbi:thiamine pyrophosphate-dependent enzyme [Variovorax boronicumulans]